MVADTPGGVGADRCVCMHACVHACVHVCVCGPSEQLIKWGPKSFKMG